MEWHIWKVKNQDIKRPASVLQIALNPSLVLLDLEWVGLTTFAGTLNSTVPHPGQELVLIWKHPQTSEVKAEAASSESLLVLKMVLENIDVGEVAKIGAIPLVAAWVQLIAPRKKASSFFHLPASAESAKLKKHYPIRMSSFRFQGRLPCSCTSRRPAIFIAGIVTTATIAMR